jgi:hypothetical protein
MRSTAHLPLHLELCRSKNSTDAVEMLTSSHIDSAEVANSWKPFTCPLGDAGIAKAILRAPTIKKLEAAGFLTLLDVCFLSLWCYDARLLDAGLKSVVILVWVKIMKVGV